MSSFKFPSIYKFPPFYTKQVHLDTANSQLSIWCKLILQYCEHYKIWVMNMNGEPVISDDEEVAAATAATSDSSESDIVPKQSLFTNPEIDRALRPEFVKEIVTQLIKTQHAEMINDNQFYVYYKTIPELSGELLQWVENTGQQGNILTLYELTHGELTKNQAYHNINQQVLMKLINHLVINRRAVVLRDEDNKIVGVKIQ